MFVTKLKWAIAVLLLLGLGGAGAGLRAQRQSVDKTHAVDAKEPISSDPENPQVPPEAPQVRRDHRGDPLPAGTLVRMGTTRLRHRESVAAVAFSPDGKFVVTGGGDGFFRLWDPATGKEIRSIREQEIPCNSLAVSPDGKLLATAATKAIRIWDTSTGQEVRSIPSDTAGATFIPLAFSPNGQTLAAGASNRSIGLWNVANGEERLRLPLQQPAVRSLGFTSDGKTLVSSSGELGNCTIQWWDLGMGKEIRKLTIAAPEKVRLRSFGLSPDGQTLAAEMAEQVIRAQGAGRVASTEYRVQLWDLATGTVRLRLEGQAEVIWAAAFSADSKQVAWMGMDNRITVADAVTGKQLHRFPGYPGGARPDGYTTLAFSVDGKALAAVGSSAAVHVWSLTTGRDVHDGSETHHDAIAGLVHSPDGRTLASASLDQTIRLWDGATGKQRHVLRDQGSGVCALVFSPDGKLLASATTHSSVHLWEVATGKLLRQIQAVARTAGVYFGIGSLAFSIDGQTLTSWGDDQRIHVWDVATGKEIRQTPVSLDGLAPPPDGRPKELHPGAAGIHGVGFSPDGRRAAVAASAAIYIVDVATGQQIFKLAGHPGPTCLAFAADGKTLVTGGWDKVARLWELTTGKELLKVQGLEHVNAVAFARDGRSMAVATGWTQGKIHVFDVRTGNELMLCQGHGAYVGALAFAADGKTLASGQRDTTILVWDLSSAIERAALPARDLSTEDLDRLWADLAGDDVQKANAALWGLVAAPAKAVPYLTERLRPIERAKPAEIQRLIADLDSNKFAVRDAASRQLQDLGVEAEPALRAVLKGTPTNEVRRRVEALLTGPTPVRVPASEDLRRLRAVQVLEYIASPEARGVLESLALGAPGAPQTREAQAAASRLAQPGR